MHAVRVPRLRRRVGTAAVHVAAVQHDERASGHLKGLQLQRGEVGRAGGPRDAAGAIGRHACGEAGGVVALGGEEAAVGNGGVFQREPHADA